MGESTEAEWQLQTDNADSMALALSSEVGGRPPDDSDEESSESDGGESASEYPPGPICAEKCTLGGPGYVGGAARSTVSFFVTAKDERGTRIRDGGAYVVATITPGNSARAAGAEVLTASVKDNNDGTYTASYAVAARGDYEVICLSWSCTKLTCFLRICNASLVQETDYDAYVMHFCLHQYSHLSMIDKQPGD